MIYFISKKYVHFLENILFENKKLVMPLTLFNILILNQWSSIKPIETNHKFLITIISYQIIPLFFKKHQKYSKIPNKNIFTSSTPNIHKLINKLISYHYNKYNYIIGLWSECMDYIKHYYVRGEWSGWWLVFWWGWVRVWEIGLWSGWSMRKGLI